MDPAENKQNAKEAWSDTDKEILAEFLLRLKGTPLSGDQLAEMRENNWNHGMYLAAMVSHKILADIVKSYKLAVQEQLYETAVKSWVANYSGCRNPVGIRSWLLNLIDPTKFRVGDYDDPSKAHVVDMEILKKVQVGMTALDGDIVEISLLNVLDQVEKTRISAVQLAPKCDDKAESAAMAATVVDFVSKVILFQQHARLVRYY
jgi:hypothetical protein